MATSTDALFQVDSPTGLRLRLAGARRGSTEYLSGPGATAGYLQVAATVNPTTTWTDETGTLRSLTGTVGPRLFEETSYKLTAEALDGRAIRVASPGRDCLTNAEPIVGHPNLVVADLNFGSAVGFASIALTADDGEAITFTVQVFPTKLDFESDYLDLLTEVAALARGLVFRYTGTVHGLASEDPSVAPSTLEWALLLKAYLERLESALNYVARRPHGQLERTTEYVGVDHIRRPSPMTFEAIRRRLGRGPEVERLGLRMLSELPVSTPRETLDTPENRWLRAAVLDIRRRLVALRRESSSWRDQQRRLGRDTDRLDREISELDGAERSVSRLLRQEPLRDLTLQPPPGFSSLVLMSRPGYREAYRAITALRTSLGLDTGALQVPLQKLSTLYEYWCYLRLAGALLELGGRLGSVGDFVRVGDHGLSVGLSRDRDSQIQFERGADRFTLRYGANFKGPTGTQKPDIVVEVDAEGWPPLLIVLDAKYRVDTSKETRDRFEGAAPPLDAVNALHRYRDAIIDNTTGRRLRPVVRGAALFPLGASDSVGYKSRPLYTSLVSLGIGALPFLPTNVSIALDWIKDLVATRPAALAEGSPAPSGTRERWQRRVDQLQPVLVLAPSALEDWRALLVSGRSIALPAVGEAVDRFTSVLAVGPPVDGFVPVRAAPIVSRFESSRSVVVGSWAESPSLEGDLELPDWSVATALAVRLAKRTSDLGLGSSVSHDVLDELPVISPPDVALARTSAGWLSATLVNASPAMELVVTGHQTWRREGADLVPVADVEEP